MRGLAATLMLFTIAGGAAASSVNFYSLEREAALGAQMALEVERQAKLVEDPLVTEFVHRVGQNVAKRAGAPFPVTIKVIQSDDINAFSLPGGHVFLNTGILRLTESEAELASVLAHEIGHVAARHMTRQATRNQLARGTAAILVPHRGLPGILGSQAAALVLPAALVKFTREFESEADRMGVSFLYRAGYDPRAAIDILERIEAAEKRRPGIVARMYETHPLTADRVRGVEKAIGRLQPGRTEFLLNSSDYEAVRRRIVH